MTSLASPPHPKMSGLSWLRVIFPLVACSIADQYSAEIRVSWCNPYETFCCRIRRCMNTAIRAANFV
jgi:hypothetical protein